MYPSQALLLAGASLVAASTHCPPLGPVLPAPKTPSSNPAVTKAVKVFQSTFDGITKSLNYSAVAISAQSIHETKPFLELFYTPPSPGPKSVKKIDGDTVFRLGSLTKLFPALSVLLLPGASLDDPVTKYLPKLHDLKKQQTENNNITTVNWNDITLGSLMTHLSGLGTDYFNDLGTLLGRTGPLIGLPNITKPEILPGCAGLFGLPACNDTQFYRDFGRRPPVYAPYTTPVYSNIAFGVLAMVAEAATNMTFDKLLEKNIFGVAGMKHTSLHTPDTTNAFIAVNESWWDAQLGVEAAGGGMYSTMNDILSFGVSILSNKYLSPLQTRKWLKPHTFTSSFGSAMGAPWEILRSKTLTKDGRLVEIYTKSGDLGFYHNQFVLVPDYDLALMVLTAGPESSPEFSEIAMSKAVQAMLPALEQAGKDEATVGLVGTYTDAATNSTLQLVLDDGPGLVVKKWIVRGSDFFDNYFRFSLSPPPASPPPVSARLYPTDLVAGNQTAWRANFEVGTTEKRVFDLESELFWEDGGCVTWAMLDRQVWAYNALDDFVITTGGVRNGTAAPSITSIGFQITLRRT